MKKSKYRKPQIKEKKIKLNNFLTRGRFFIGDEEQLLLASQIS